MIPGQLLKAFDRIIPDLHSSISLLIAFAIQWKRLTAKDVRVAQWCDECLGTMIPGQLFCIDQKALW
jgi:hypothetical protein